MRWDQALRIGSAERDISLGLDSPNFPDETTCPFGWGVVDADDSGSHPRYLARIIEGPRNPGTLERNLIREIVVRWPSAPIYEINRETEYELKLTKSHYHTLRVFRDEESFSEGKPASRCFLVHNGLNEVSDLRFYSNLTQNLILGGWSNTAVILHSNPGHLFRFPFPGDFTEKPLDRYLSDPGDLFRQFLRCMYETEWILTALTDPAAGEAPLTGLSLFAPYSDFESRKHPEAKRRHNASLQASRIADEFDLLSSANEEYRKRRRQRRADQGTDGVDSASSPPLPSEKTIVPSVNLLRRAILGREGIDSSSSDSAPPDQSGSSPDGRGVVATGAHNGSSSLPAESAQLEGASESNQVPIHCIGYSLGGFLAQSIFFAWPSRVASCSSICSGGPLSDIQLSGFAQPEEWQQVIYGLRYELESLMVSDDLRNESLKLNIPTTNPRWQESEHNLDAIGGVPTSRFRIFLRVFYDVFVQDFRSQYAKRVAEFVDRMLFVVGGGDSIIRPESVLSAGPAGGVNFLQVANLSHFVHRPNPDFERYWLPRITSLIVQIARRGEEQTSQDGQDALREDKKKRGAYRAQRARDVPFSSSHFQHALSRILTSATNNSNESHLMISRSRVPVDFLDSSAREAVAVSLHSHAADAENYLLELDRQAEFMSQLVGNDTDDDIGGLTVILSKKGVRWTVQDEPMLARFPRFVRGQVHGHVDQLFNMREQFEDWKQKPATFRLFGLEDPERANVVPVHHDKTRAAAARLVNEIRSCLYENAPASMDPLDAVASRDFGIINTMPDAWLYLHRELLTSAIGGIDSRQAVMARDREVTVPKLEGLSRLQKEAWVLDWARALFLEGWDPSVGSWSVPSDQPDGSAMSFMKTWLGSSRENDDAKLEIVRLSRSRSDSNYRGLGVRSLATACQVWIHTALTYAYSTAIDHFDVDEILPLRSPTKQSG